MALSEYMISRQALKNGTREKDPPKAKQPLRSVGLKRQEEIKEERASGIRLEKKAPKKKFGGRSEKMKGIMAAIQPLYRSFLKEKPICEIKSPVCTSEAACIHHTAGRGMSHLMDTNTWEAACSACNLYVEEHDQWARDNGHKYSKHKKG